MATGTAGAKGEPKEKKPKEEKKEKSKSPKKEKAMSTKEWNDHARIASLMSGSPIDWEKLLLILPEAKQGKKISLMVPKSKFAYQF